MVNMIKLQIGKKGLTPEFIEQIKRSSENIENIRISMLKSSGRDKKQIQQVKDELVTKLGPKFTATVIGFTIIVKKWRKSRE